MFQHNGWIIDEFRHVAGDACLRLAVEERIGQDPGPLCIFSPPIEFTPEDVERACELLKGYPVNRREILFVRDIR